MAKSAKKSTLRKTQKKKPTVSKKKAIKNASTKKNAASKKKVTAKRKAALSKKKSAAYLDNSKIMESIMSTSESKFEKLAGNATKSNKEQMDAVTKSGDIFVKGLEDIAKTYMDWAQTSTEKNSQAFKSLLSCKSINEYTETHNKWVQQNFDDFMSGATQLSELGVKVTSEAFEPINDQITKSVQKAAESLAA